MIMQFQEHGIPSGSATWLFTLKRPKADLKDCIEKLIADLKVSTNGSWSCGNTKRIEVGDLFYLTVQGKVNPGIIGWGVVTKRPYSHKHWDPLKIGKTALFVDVLFKDIRNPFEEICIKRSQLENIGSVRWDTQSGGILIPEETARELTRMWLQLKGETKASSFLQP